jgi:hypothetical protein
MQTYGKRNQEFQALVSLWHHCQHLQEQAKETHSNSGDVLFCLLSVLVIILVEMIIGFSL